MQNISWEVSKKKPLSGFTLIEVLVVVFVLSMGVLVIMQGINKTTTYISETAQRTVALNLAKEGLEAMYNIRNTNWRRRSDSRDKCWLKANPMVDEGNLGCEDDEWIYPGEWSIYQKDIQGNKYFSTEVVYTHPVYYTNPMYLMMQTRKWIDQYEDYFKKEWVRWRSSVRNDPLSKWWKHYLYFIDWEWKDRENFVWDVTKHRSPLGDYWRVISVNWVFDKNTGHLLHCEKWTEWNCWNSSPKEFRFCSIVVYTEPYLWFVNVCSIMTNFLK